MFLAALTSRSWTAPHRQVHDLTTNGFGPSTTPHTEHNCDDGNQRSITAKMRPLRAALSSSRHVNIDQPASCTDFASLVRAKPLTHKSSTYTAWFLRMIVVDALCTKSRRASATSACARATSTGAFSRFFDPFGLRAKPCCALRSFRSARRKNTSGARGRSPRVHAAAGVHCGIPLGESHRLAAYSGYPGGSDRTDSRVLVALSL